MDSDTSPNIQGPIRNLIHGHALLGWIGESLTCGKVISLAHSFGDLASPEGDGLFVIGHDIRSSSSSLAESASLGLRSGGHHVTHLGTCTKPLLEWYIEHIHAHGGLYIGGDCKPADWNGLWAYLSGGRPLMGGTWLETLIDYDLNHLFSHPCNGYINYEHPMQAFAASLRQRFHPKSYMKVCLDAGNGLAGEEFEAVFAHYRQIRISRIAFHPDPNFPVRGPDPYSSGALTGLLHCVQRNGAHLGASLNADGDTLAVIDERGQPVPADIIGTLLALYLAAGRPQLLILYGHEVRTSLREVLERSGIQLT